MKRAVLIVLLVLLSGCAKEPPKMAGNKWANALRDPDAKVRKKAAFTLGNIGPSDPAVLPALVGALRDADASVRCETIFALVKYGPGAMEVVLSQLTELREKDRDPKVRTYAAKALEKLNRGK